MSGRRPPSLADVAQAWRSRNVRSATAKTLMVLRYLAPPEWCPPRPPTPSRVAGTGFCGVNHAIRVEYCRARSAARGSDFRPRAFHPGAARPRVRAAGAAGGRARPHAGRLQERGFRAAPGGGPCCAADHAQHRARLRVGSRPDGRPRRGREFVNRDGLLDYPSSDVRFQPDEVLFTPGTRSAWRWCSRCSGPTARVSSSPGRAGSTTGSSNGPASTSSSCRHDRPSSCRTRTSSTGCWRPAAYPCSS